MTLLSANEIFYLVILTAALGYIFSGFIQKPRSPYEIYKNKMFDWENIKFAAIVSAPAVILHEFGHKFVAMAFGLQATFHIWPTGLGLGIILRAINAPFLILAPAYVSIPAGVTALQGFLISFAGPFTNLILWISSALFIKYGKLARNVLLLFILSAQINKILFIFNMLPFPPLDGYKVFTNLFTLLSVVF
ncbi:MAG: hypothetical protein ABIF40_02105 [archaeon]